MKISYDAVQESGGGVGCTECRLVIAVVVTGLPVRMHR